MTEQQPQQPKFRAMWEWSCLTCGTRTMNWRKCKRCKSDAVLVPFIAYPELAVSSISDEVDYPVVASGASDNELRNALTAQLALNAKLKRDVEQMRANFLHYCGLDHQIFCANHEPLTGDEPITACPMCQRDQLLARLCQAVIVLTDIYNYADNLEDIQPKNIAERIQAVLSANSSIFLPDESSETEPI